MRTARASRRAPSLVSRSPPSPLLQGGQLPLVRASFTELNASRNLLGLDLSAPLSAGRASRPCADLPRVGGRLDSPSMRGCSSLWLSFRAALTVSACRRQRRRRTVLGTGAFPPAAAPAASRASGSRRRGCRASRSPPDRQGSRAPATRAARRWPLRASRHRRRRREQLWTRAGRPAKLEARRVSLLKRNRPAPFSATATAKDVQDVEGQAADGVFRRFADPNRGESLFKCWRRRCP